jgi:hypothetical protein
MRDVEYGMQAEILMYPMVNASKQFLLWTDYRNFSLKRW